MPYAMTFTKRPALERLARIEAMLTERPHSIHELADKLHCAKKTAILYVNHLKPQIHVAKWQRNPDGGPTPLWAWGKQRDACRPKKYTRADRNRRYADRKRRDVEMALDARARALSRALQPRRDAMVAAFFGAAA
jgi:hypothetical protein